MRQTSIFSCAVAATALVPACLASPRLEERQDEDDIAAVCKPPVGDAQDVRPPCSHIEYIETMCWPKGDEPVHYDGHAQCMCKGSYFDEWAGCQNCLEVHGFRSERDTAFYSSVVSSASEMLCTGTPTAPFRSLFAEAEANMSPVTTGATDKSDQFPGETDVSLYYTPTGTQGPGEVTGPAATASRAGGLATAGPAPGQDEGSTGTTGKTTTTRTTSADGTASTSEDPDSAAHSNSSTLGLVIALAGMSFLVALK